MHAYRKYRVVPNLTAAQKSDIRRLRDGQRQSYNWAVERLRFGWSTGDEYGMYREHTTCRHTCDWMRDVPAAIQRAGIRDAFTAARMAAKRGRGTSDGLKYRSKKRPGRGAFKCPLAPAMVDARTIKLPRFGTVKCAEPVPPSILGGDLRSYEFVDVSGGRGEGGRGPRYVLYVSCRVEVPERAETCAVAPRTVKGVDRGTVNPTTVSTISPSDGRVVDKTSYDTAAPFRSDRGRYQGTQRRMSRMSKKSGRYRRLLRAARRQARRVRNRRAYAECLAAKHICTDHSPGTVVFENLSISGMTRRGRGKHKKGLNREMRFVRHYELEMRVRNRAELEGITVKHVDPAYTSQTCSGCGHASRKSRVTRDIFKCTKCGYIQNADINAATNIGRRGLPTPPGGMHGAGPPEVGMPFVRREMDVRRNRFVEVGAGALRGRRENTSAGTSPFQMGMEKERLKMFCSTPPRKQWRTQVYNSPSLGPRLCI